MQGDGGGYGLAPKLSSFESLGILLMRGGGGVVAARVCATP